MKLLLLIALAACSLNHDYGDPAVGNQAEAALEDCRSDRYLPCGWVRACPSVERDNPIGALEVCVLWQDRITNYPLTLNHSLESLYGDCPLSWDERFRGIPLCRYTCPTMMGCNAYDGCFCLDEPQP